jgi:hypothetical protein
MKARIGEVRRYGKKLVRMGVLLAIVGIVAWPWYGLLSLVGRRVSDSEQVLRAARLILWLGVPFAVWSEQGEWREVRTMAEFREVLSSTRGVLEREDLD